MKKLLIFTMVAMLAFILTGCGTKKDITELVNSFENELNDIGKPCEQLNKKMEDIENSILYIDKKDSIFDVAEKMMERQELIEKNPKIKKELMSLAEDAKNVCLKAAGEFKSIDTSKLEEHINLETKAALVDVKEQYKRLHLFYSYDNFLYFMSSLDKTVEAIRNEEKKLYGDYRYEDYENHLEKCKDDSYQGCARKSLSKFKNVAK